jgi:hypothetical protein
MIQGGANDGPRRFPPPWTVEELDACFVVTDSTGPRLNRPSVCVDPVRISWLFLPTKRTVRHHRLRPLNHAPVAERPIALPPEKQKSVRC